MRGVIGTLLLGAAAGTLAQAERTSMEECLLRALESAAGSVTVGELRQLCALRELVEKDVAPTEADTVAAAVASRAHGGLSKRNALERYTRNNPFVLTPHKPNYVLPLVYTKDPSEDSNDPSQSEQDKIEVQFQLSLEVMVWENMFGDNGHLSVAYTNRSFWQAYNSEASASFRETNHEPELILTFENDWEVLGFRNVANQLIFNHQSNGQDVPESRSWNRVMANFMFERNNFVFAFKPWYRIPENDKDSPDDPSGDDNPDIERYLGHFEWIGSWQYRNNNFSLLLRNNLRSDNKGAAELSWSFPIGGRIKGYVKYFNGYGESLIDYDAHTESLGVGFLVTDWF